MGDVDFLIQIIAKLRDEASPKIAALRAELDKLKGTQDAENAQSDLSDAIKDTGDKADRSKKQHEDLRHEQEKSRRAAEDASKGARNLTEDIDRAGRSHDNASDKVDAHTKSQEEFVDALSKVKKESRDASSGIKDLDDKMESLLERSTELNEKSFLPQDTDGLNKQREAWSDLDRQIKSVANSYSRLATSRKVGEDNLRSDAIHKAEEGFLEAAQARAEAERLQKLTPASRHPLSIDTAEEAKRIKIDEDQANAQKDLELRVSQTRTAYRDFEDDLAGGNLSKGEATRALKEFSSSFSGLRKELVSGRQDLGDTDNILDDISKKLKNPEYTATGGFTNIIKRIFSGEGNKSDIGDVFEAIDSKVGDLGIRITGVASALQGFFDLAKIGLSQQLITGVLSLAGGLVSVASAAAQAGAALAGAFISGVGQAIPMLAVVAASLERFKNILQAVSVAGQAEQQHFYDPSEKQVTQLQNVSQLISSQQQLSNSYTQVYEAQQRVRDSQISLTEARYTAQRQITELANAEKNARLEAEGANLSLAESKRQLQIAIQKGDTAGLQQAELAVKEAELNKRTSEYAVPKAEREARLARERGVSGAPSVISAVEGLEGAKVAQLQAQQAGEAAKRQQQITELQQAARSSKETTYESQEKFLKKGMSPTELGLTDALIGIEKELKSPDSPLKKITDYFVEPFTNAVEKIRSLLHNANFLGPIDELAKAMGAGLGKLEHAAYGGSGTSFFESMARDASSNIPIVTEAIEHLMKLFEDIAKTADPAFHKLSEDWNQFWGTLDKKYEGEGLTRLEQFFNKSTEYAEKFAKLGSALFGLFKAIGSDAAPQGIITVASFTGAIKDATSWVQSHGPEVTKFFSEARIGLGLIGSTLLQVGKELLEVFNLDSLRALSGFLNEVLLPGLRLVVNILGEFTKVVLDFFNALGKPGRDALGIIGAVIVALVGISKIYEPIKTAITLMKGLRAATLALLAGEKITGAWAALAAAFDKTGKSAAAAKDEITGLTAAEEANTAAASGDAAASDALAAGEAGAGGSGLLGGAAGLARGAVLPLGAITAATLLREGGQQTGPSGLPVGSTSIGGQFNRYTGKEFGDLEHLNIGGFVGGILGTSNDESSSELKLRGFGNEVEKLKGKLSSLPNSKLQEIQHEAESLAQNSALEKFKGVLENTAKAFNPSEVAARKWSESIKEYLEHLSPAAKNIATTFESINLTSGSIWKNISNVVKENTENIKENLGLNSKQGKEALSANFEQATIKIEESMKKGGMSVQKGMDRIRELVSDQLKIFGVHPSEIEKGASAAGNIGRSVSKGLSGFAAGGYIPAQPGGRIARVAEAGHDEVVLSTDPAHATRSRALLGQYFSRAPHMAAGGFVADPGTNFTVNQEPKIVTELRKLGEYLGTTIYGISGYRSPGHSVAVGGFSNDPHTRGEAADIGVGSNSRESAAKLTAALLAKFDLYRPFYPASAAEINHIQLLPGDVSKIAGSAGGLAGSVGGIAQSIHNIISPKIKGGGTIGKVAQAALNMATAAANIFLDKHSSSGEPEVSGSIGTNWSGSWVHVMEQIAKAKHWSLAAWRAVINKESGGNPNALGSPTIAGSDAKGLSRAYGLGQFLGSTYTEYSKYGADSSDPVKQIEAMAQYIENDYGTPTGALASENSRGYYAAGGIVGDQIRRLAVRHLRKKALKFAQGGRAPWGGEPVPIIAHAGERIMNPAQYHETARLAGTSPDGLDRHLGYDSSPRQHFADGGLVVKDPHGRAQPLTSGSAFEPHLERDFENIIEESNNFVKIFKKVKQAFSKLKKTSGDKFSKDLEKIIKEITEETNGVLARMQEGREFFKSKLERKSVEKDYTKKGGKIQLGPRGEVGIAEATSKNLFEESRYLQQERKIIDQSIAETKKLKPSNARTSALHDLMLKQKELGEVIDQNIEARYQAETQALQDKITEVNNSFQVISQEQTAAVSGAQGLGKLGEIGGIEQQIRRASENQLTTLAPLLKEAESLGNKELASTIKQEMVSLRQTITNSVVETISNAQTLIQRESGLSESKVSLLQSYSKIAAQEGRIGKAGDLEKESLEYKSKSLLSTRYQEEKLQKEAAQAGDTAAVITLTEELNKNRSEIAENNLALKENSVVTRELVLSQIQATGQFKTGVYSAATQGLETLGNITGYHNVAGLLGAAKGREGALGTERTELESQARGIGLGVEGMTPSQILSYLASPEGQMKLSQLEKGEDKGEKESMYKLVSALETNATNTLKSAEEIAKLNGQLNQPQSFTTQAFSQFRSAFFNGMGGVLPQYASALPPGALEGMPKYGEMAPGASRAAPTIGNLSLTHPVEKLDPALLGEELSHHINNTPTMQ